MTLFSKHHLTAEEEADAVSKLRGLLGEEVHQHLTRGGEEGLTEATLRRWVRARKGDVAKAARDLTEHAEWRSKAVPDGRIMEVIRKPTAPAGVPY